MYGNFVHEFNILAKEILIYMSISILYGGQNFIGWGSVCLSCGSSEKSSRNTDPEYTIYAMYGQPLFRINSESKLVSAQPWSDNYLQFPSLRSLQYKYTNNTQKLNQDNHFSLLLTNIHKRIKQVFCCATQSISSVCVNKRPLIESFLIAVSRTIAGFNTSPHWKYSKAIKRKKKKTFLFTQIRMSS